MMFAELKQQGKKYSDGYINALPIAYQNAREDICKFMYKNKKKTLTMYEICDVLRTSENDYIKLCTSFGLGTGYLDDSDEELPFT